MAKNYQYDNLENHDLVENILIKQKELQELLVDPRNDQTLSSYSQPSVPPCYVYNVNPFNYQPPPYDHFLWRPILPDIKEQPPIYQQPNQYCVQLIPRHSNNNGHQLNGPAFSNQEQCKIPLPQKLPFVNENKMFNNNFTEMTTHFRIINNVPVAVPIPEIEQLNRKPRPILGICKNNYSQYRKPTFNKKFPIQKHNIFHSGGGANYVNDPETRNIEITFQSLSIGPKFELKSEMTKILERYYAAFDYLKELSTNKCLSQLLLINNDNETSLVIQNEHNYENYLLFLHNNLSLFEYFNHFYKIVHYEYEQSTIEIMTKVRLIATCGVGYSKDGITNSHEILTLDAQSAIQSFRWAIDAYYNCRQFKIMAMDSSMVLNDQNEINLLMETISKITTDIRKVSTFIWMLCGIVKRQQKHNTSSTPIVPQASTSLSPKNKEMPNRIISPIERNVRRVRNTFIGGI